MTELSTTPVRGWRYGIHPNVVGSQVRSLGRVELPLGEALRLEAVSADRPEDDIVHLQYYIHTELGAWALWQSCSRAELADREAVLRQIVPPFGDEG